MLISLLLLAFTVVKTQGFKFADAEHTALLQRSRRAQIQVSEDLDGTPNNKAGASAGEYRSRFDILEQKVISTLEVFSDKRLQFVPCSFGRNNDADAIEFAKAKRSNIRGCHDLTHLCTTQGADFWLVHLRGRGWEGWGGERLSKSVRQTCPGTCNTPCSELRHGCADVYPCPVGMSTALTRTLDNCDAATCTPVTGPINDANDVNMVDDNDDAGPGVATGTTGGDENNPWTVLVKATAQNVKSDIPTDAEKYKNNVKEYEFKLVFSSATRTVTMQWAQTSWLTSRKRPSGFRSISISDTMGAVKWAKFNGLRNCGSKAAFCSYGQWAAVGQYRIHKGGIQAWPPRKKWGGQFIAGTAELQVSIPKGKNL